MHDGSNYLQQEEGLSVESYYLNGASVFIFFKKKKIFLYFFRFRFLWYQWPLPCIMYCETPWKQTPYTWFAVCLTFIEGTEYKQLQSTFSSRSVKYAACLCVRLFILVQRAVLAFIVTCFSLALFLYLKQPILQGSWWWLCLTHCILISPKAEV